MRKSTWIGCIAVATTGVAWAGAQLESTLSSCSTINCSGMTIRGVHQAREPFVTQIYALRGECMRLEISEQSADTALLVLSPSVLFGQGSDDRDGADDRPLLLLDALPWTGWYTVVVSNERTGNATVRFELEYGRYPGGNANCQAAAAAAGGMPGFQRLYGNPIKAIAPQR